MRLGTIAVALGLGGIGALAAGLGPGREVRSAARGGDAVAPGTLVSGPEMQAPRAAHTATTLPDGRVLVAGGFTGEASAATSAEVFDPVHGTFAPLPRMVTPRHSHTATLLPDGRVLIAGGYAAGNAPIVAAELFDPVAGTFTPTGPLRAPRAGHVAVLLGDGRVLLAGGIGPDWTFLASAELYDPATGRFAPTGDLTVPRESHVAVRLSDGRILVVGGHQGRRADITLYASAEVYDPADGTFRRVAEMGVRRHKHDAIVLGDGRVLVTGGADERDSEGVYRSTELFDPKSLTFSPGPELRLPRYKHQGSSLLLPNGQVLLAGGAPQAELFDPATNAFSLVSGEPRMAGQFSAAALLAGGGALITGGYGNRGGPRASTWVYRP